MVELAEFAGAGSAKCVGLAEFVEPAEAGSAKCAGLVGAGLVESVVAVAELAKCSKFAGAAAGCGHGVGV